MGGDIFQNIIFFCILQKKKKKPYKFGITWVDVWWQNFQHWVNYAFKLFKMLKVKVIISGYNAASFHQLIIIW